MKPGMFGGLHIRWHSLMRIACYLLGVSKDSITIFEGLNVNKDKPARLTHSRLFA